MESVVCKGAECTDIQVLQHEQFGTLRAMCDADGEWWFVAKDVCDVLDIRTNSIRSILDDDEVNTLNDNSIVISRGKAPLVVSEAGLYSLILRSRKPEAKTFKRWITHDVLPTLRREGVYTTTTNANDAIERITSDVAAIVQRETCAAMQRVTEAEAKAAALEDEVFHAYARVDKVTRAARAFDGVSGGLTITEASRHLTALCDDVKRKDVISLLRGSGYICKSSLAPTQFGIRRGVVIPAPVSTHKRSDGTLTLNPQYSYVTPKGLGWLAQNLLCARTLSDVRRACLTESLA